MRVLKLLFGIKRDDLGKAKSYPKGSIRARVYRAATGKWEDLGIISKPKKGGS